MTALQKLRHHQGLLVGLILFALFAFVLGEVISSRDRIFSSDRTTVASVGDNKLGVEEYRAMINEFMEANKQYNVGYGMAAEQVYQNWVLQNVREEQYARCLAHLQQKYAEGGYLRLWIAESENARRLEELRGVIRDPQRLRKMFDAAFDTETAE